MAVHADNDDSSSTLDPLSFIPPEMREAAAAMEAEGVKPSVEVDEGEDILSPNLEGILGQRPTGSKKAAKPQKSQVLSEDKPVVLADEEDEEIIEDDDDDYKNEDISDDYVEKILKGEIDDDSEEEEDFDDPTNEGAFWKQDDDYKNLVGELNSYGVETSEIDKLIRKVADTTKINTSKVVQGFQAQLDAAKEEKEALLPELEKLRDLKRAVSFDFLESTRTKYGIPMQEASSEIRNILTREGIDSKKVSLDEVLAAKNKTQLITLFKDVDIDENEMTKLTGQWRGYKDTELEYISAREAAKGDISKLVTAKITPEAIENNLKYSLRDFVKAEGNEFISKAINEGLDKHPRVQKMLNLAKKNYTQMIENMKVSSEALSDPKFLQGFATYMYRTALDAYAHEELKEVKAREAKTEEKLRRVVHQLKKYTKAGKGITGRGSSVPGMINSRKGSKSVGIEDGGEITEDAIAEFEEMITNPNLLTKKLFGESD